MSAEDWQQIKSLFHAAVDLNVAERAAFLTGACVGEAELRRRVEALTCAHDRAGDFLVKPAYAGAKLTARES